jgi:hypothetical protein
MHGLDEQGVVAPSNGALQRSDRIVLAPSRADRPTVGARGGPRPVAARGAKVGRHERIHPVAMERPVCRCEETRQASEPLHSIACVGPDGTRVVRGDDRKELPVPAREAGENLIDEEVGDGPGGRGDPG